MLILADVENETSPSPSRIIMNNKQIARPKLNRSSAQTDVTAISQSSNDHSAEMSLTSDEFARVADAASRSRRTSSTESVDVDDDDSIYYFGYGPIVNPIVRYRRGCKIPPENIQAAILYDHRLRFVEGGTACVVPRRGWDVKGVLLKFDDPEEFHRFRNFDPQYEVHDVSVSVISKTDVDPKKMSSKVAPFQDDAEEDDDEEDEEDCGEYSCPFSVTTSATSLQREEDPNSIRAVTFTIALASSNSNRNIYSQHHCITPTSCDGSNVVSMPQERYLKLIEEGLRAHEIDETYIRDEILSVNYIPSERDKIEDCESYRRFPSPLSSNGFKRLPKIAYAKYESKLCAPKKISQDLYFVCGRRVVKLQDDYDPRNPVAIWLKELCHGHPDSTLLVHQTFVDTSNCTSLALPLVDCEDDLTPEHTVWAEHTLVLFLERGGLAAQVVSEINDRPKLETSISSVGRSMPSLTLTSSMTSSMIGMFTGKHRSLGRSGNESTCSNGSDSQKNATWERQSGPRERLALGLNRTCHAPRGRSPLGHSPLGRFTRNANLRHSTSSNTASASSPPPPRHRKKFSVLKSLTIPTSKHQRASPDSSDNSTGTR